MGNEFVFDYQIVERIAVLSERGNVSKELNLISFNGRKPKYDLRSWQRDGEEVKMLKGVTLSENEMERLKKVLTGMCKQELLRLL